MANSWTPYVALCQKAGFPKVTIVDRKTYATLACSANSDIATAYNVTEEVEGTSKTFQVNENQELLDDWKDAKKKVFRFYGLKSNILLRDDEDGAWIVANKKGFVTCARKFTSVYFVVSAPVGSKGAKKKKGGGSATTAFKSAPQAFNAVSKIWDPLIEAGV
mmetsp:Transcript_87433/g.107189  ORF Transcript_87433/g.107189 Transcript_87433/m.107189 type:complete len:162 (+) Transcript_87433:119-604(+)